MPNKSDNIDLIRKSKTHRKIVQFFLENQGSIDTPRGIATWTNENLQNVRIALEDLVKNGILKAHRTSSTIGYSCAITEKKLSQIYSCIKK